MNPSINFFYVSMNYRMNDMIQEKQKLYFHSFIPFTELAYFISITNAIT